MDLSGLQAYGVLLAIGALVGLLIGISGIGSGSVLTPLLILLGGMSPTTAVGTSLLFSFVTKLFASWTFLRRGMVDFHIVRHLSFGAVPGTLFGASLIRYLGVRRPDVLDTFVLRAIGTVLILVALIMFLRLLPGHVRPSAVDRTLPFSPAVRRVLIVLIGFAVGVAFSVTSIGSAALVIPAMVLFYRVDAGTLVGTNVFAATFLALIALIPHAGLGHVEWKGVLALICGSLPAVWLTSRLHGRVPRHIPEGIIALALLVMGLAVFAR